MLRVHQSLDGGPYETLKENAIAMLGPASRDESMESVMVESTMGAATKCIEIVYLMIDTLCRRLILQECGMHSTYSCTITLPTFSLFVQRLIMRNLLNLNTVRSYFGELSSFKTCS